METTQVAKSQIVDTSGRAISSAKTKGINLDLSFFSNTGAGNITSDQIKSNPYRYHVWVHGAVNAIMRNIAKLPMVISEREDPTSIIDDRWGIINRMRRPNLAMTGTTFIQFIGMYLMLPANGNGRDPGGQTFMTPKDAFSPDGKVDLTKGKVPDTFYPYSSKFFKPKVVKTARGMGKVEGWQFEIPGKPNSKLVYEDSELIRIYQPNPNDWLGGLSNFEPARIAMVQDVLSDLYNTGLYDNNSIPSGILNSKSFLDDPQREDILKSWHDNYGGVGNQGRTAVLDADTSYQAIGLTPADMQYQKMKEDAFERIVAAYGVNKIAFGKYESLNFATIQEGIKFLWTDTYQPMANLIMEAINEQWIRYVDENIQLRFDYSNIEALQKNFVKPSNAYKLLVAGGFPPELAARINNIPLSKADLARWPELSEMPPAYIGNSAAPEEDEQGVLVNGMSDPVTGKVMIRTTRHKRIESREEDDLSDLERHEKEKKLFSIQFIEKVLTPSEKKYRKMIDRFLISQRNRIQTKIDDWAKGQKDVKTLLDLLIKAGNPPKAKDFMLNLEEENKKLAILMKPLIKEQLKITEAALEAELDGLISWNVDNNMVDKFVKMRKKGIMEINTTTFKKAGNRIGDAIEVSIKENMTVGETAKLLKGSVGDAIGVRQGQAEMIARTETGIVTQTARNDAFKEEGIEYHEWVTAEDDKVRHTHVEQGEASNSVVKVGETFEPTGLKFPLDPSGPPEEIINCRCVTVAAEKP